MKEKGPTLTEQVVNLRADLKHSEAARAALSSRAEQVQGWYDEERKVVLALRAKLDDSVESERRVLDLNRDLLQQLQAQQGAVMEYALALSIDAPKERLIDLQQRIAGTRNRGGNATCIDHPWGGIAKLGRDVAMEPIRNPLHSP